MTAQADADARSADVAGDSALKGQLNGIDLNKFTWTFIPTIPTAACSNPSLKSPLGDFRVDIDICGGFNSFSSFLNALLAVLCVYGCVRQIQEALRE
jgi:hypothetical protein